MSETINSPEEFLLKQGITETNPHRVFLLSLIEGYNHLLSDLEFIGVFPERATQIGRKHGFAFTGEYNTINSRTIEAVKIFMREKITQNYSQLLTQILNAKKSFSTQLASQKEELIITEPKDLMDAIDKTSNTVVLEKLWEIIKIQLKEEDDRRNSTIDRASKFITYSLTILAFFAVLITKIESVPTTSLEIFLFSFFIFASIILMILLYIIIRKAITIVSSGSYVTWAEDELRKVNLGSDENMYWRFLIKASYRNLQTNKEENNRQMDNIDRTAARLKQSALLAFI